MLSTGWLHTLDCFWNNSVLEVFSFGFLGKSKKVWPACSRDTCVGGDLGVLQLCIPVAWSSDSWRCVPPACWLPWKPCWLPSCEHLHGWSCQADAQTWGAEINVGWCPSHSTLTNGQWVFMDLGLPGSWALLGPCSFVLPRWEYF